MENYEEEFLDEDLEPTEEQINIKKEYAYRNYKYLEDPMELYLNEIGKYPLLTLEEEKLYSKNLKLIFNSKIASKEVIEGRCTNVSLNTDKVFTSCIDNKEYETVISSLISYYKTKEEVKEKEVYTILKKYKKLTNEKGRSLTLEELKEEFKINDSEKLSSTELLKETKDFITYKTAFDKMFTSNLRLVISVAKRYNALIYLDSSNISLLDLINSRKKDKENNMRKKYKAYFSHKDKE